MTTIVKAGLLLLIAGCLGIAIDGVSPPAFAKEPLICRKVAEIINKDRDHLLNKSQHFAQRTNRSRADRCRQTFWSRFKAKPASEIMNGAVYRDYQSAIKKNECGRALRLLRQRFAQAHPQAPSIISGKDDGRLWTLFTRSTYYPDLDVCLQVQAIAEAQAKIDRLGIQARPFLGPTNLPKPKNADYAAYASIIVRDNAVNALVQIGQRTNYDGAPLALLKLSQEGKALRLHPLGELYMAYRLRQRNGRDALLDKIISQPVDDQTRMEIRARALKGDDQGIPIYRN